MDFDIEQIIWNETEYKLKFVLDNPNFVLPQTVQVLQGHMIDEDDAIASGQVLTIYDKKRIEKLVGFDAYSKDIQVNLDCQYKVRLIGLGKEKRYTSVSDFCYCEVPPKYLRVENDVILATGEELKTDSVIETGDYVYSDDGRIIGLVCTVYTEDDKQTKDQQQTISLPVDYKNIFIETISPEVQRKTYLLSEIIQEFKFPFQIEFLAVSDRSCGYGPQLGVITIQRKKISNMVLATSVIEGIKHALTFSADLPITLQVAIGVQETWKSENIKMQNNIDLKKFDYLADNSPYDTAIVQRVYDELHTPSLPRRNESAHAHRHRNISKYTKRADTYAGSPVPRERPPQIKRNKSLDFSRDMKDFERYVKSKLGFKKLKNSVTKFGNNRQSRSKNTSHSERDQQHGFEYDTISNATFMTSDDGSSSNGVYSTDITSNGSGSTFNETYNNIIDCMDAISIDQSVMTPRRRRRKGSGDSGICVYGRKKTRSRSQSRSRLTPDTPSSNQSDSLLDNFSEWSIPVHQGGNSPRMNGVNVNNNKIESNNYLWTAKIKPCEETNRDEIADKTVNLYDNELQNTDLITETSSGAMSPLTSKQLQSMDEIRKLNEEGVRNILEEIQLSKYKSIFQLNQINGELLLDLEIDDLLNDCKLSLFQAKKLVKYINGWRPEDQQRPYDVSSRRKSLNPRDWSVNDVLVHMTTINLPDLGRFCSENQVNGDLLLDILDKETLQSLKNDHNVKMSSIDSKKLLNFVVKGWRPDNSPKKSIAAL